MSFQGRGRPQGNFERTDLRLFPKNPDFFKVGAARRATLTKLTVVYFQRARIFKVLKYDFRKIHIILVFLTLRK